MQAIKYPELAQQFINSGFELLKLGKAGYIVNHNGQKIRFGNLQTAGNWLNERITERQEVIKAQTWGGSVLTQFVVQASLAALEQTWSVQLAAKEETQETAVATIYTTANAIHDIPELTLEAVELDLMNGKKRRWRSVKTLDAEKQLAVYKTQNASAVDTKEWGEIKDFQVPVKGELFDDLGNFLSKSATEEKDKPEAVKPEQVSDHIGANGKPKAVKTEDGIYQAGKTTKSVRSGSKIDQIINLLREGATIEQINAKVDTDKKMSASYIAQRLALRGYGMAKDIATNRYFLLTP
ncbi:MAG: hypothetical protein ACREPR_03125 [Brasilonema sp.]